MAARARADGTHPLRPLHLLEAAVALLFWGLFRLLPVDAASALGGWLARSIGPLTSAQGVARDNLTQAFPDKTAAEINTILRGMWDNLGRTVGEFPHVNRIMDPKAGRVEVVGREKMERLRDDDAPGLFYSAHLANWELPPILATQNNLPLHVFYRAANNPLIEKLYRKGRGGVKGDLLPKGREGAKRGLLAMKRGEHLAMLVDQKMNDGLPIPFFGRPAMTAPALAQLALRFKAPIATVRVVRLKGVRFRIIFESLINSADFAARYEENTQKAVIALMTEINAEIESWIRHHPEQWLWAHRRWPKGSG